MLAILFLLPFICSAQIIVNDDLGHQVTLAHPAKRIITLAPNLTEIVEAAGAGAYLVGVSSYSDFPDYVKSLPQVNTASELNLELILSLKPDLVVAWQGGNPANQLEKIRALKIPIFYSQPLRLADISDTIITIGKLAATEQTATKQANAFNVKWKHLEKNYKQQKTVTVFYQLAAQPLLTLNKQSLINEVIKLCGGKNVFENTLGLVPEVTYEAVLQANPDVIIAMQENGLQHWQAFRTLRAVQHKQLYVINSDLLERYGPRLMDGAEMLCGDLSQARQLSNKSTH